MKQDLLFVLPDLNVGGAQKVATMLANYWAEKNSSVKIVGLSGSSQSFFPLSAKVAVLTVATDGQRRGGRLLKPLAKLGLIFRLRRLLRRDSKGLILSFGVKTNILVILAAIGLGKVVVVAERNNPATEPLGRSWQWLRRWLYGRADLVTANSQPALRALSAFIPEENLAFLPNPVAKAAARDGATEKPSSFLCVGPLVFTKGYDVILRAFALFNELMPGWIMEFVGDGPHRVELEDLTAKLGLTPQVFFRGQVLDLNPYFHGAEIFLLPSRSEGTPNALLEALSFGLPAIISDTAGGALQWIEHEKTGLVVPGGDVLAFAKAMARLAGNKTLAGVLAQEAKKSLNAVTLAKVAKTWELILGDRMPAASDHFVAQRAKSIGP